VAMKTAGQNILGTSVLDPKPFGTDPNPEFDIRTLQILTCLFIECLESTCVLLILAYTKTCITCLNVNKLMCNYIFF
jgi:hypothetical protein